MNISRRSFLGGAMVATALAALPALAKANVPTIYADGVQDDFPGLQAMIDGKPFRIAGEGVFENHAGDVVISDARLALSEPLDLSRPHGTVTMTRCHLRRV
jgi:hypothetical protein